MYVSSTYLDYDNDRHVKTRETFQLSPPEPTVEVYLSQEPTVVSSKGKYDPGRKKPV